MKALLTLLTGLMLSTAAMAQSNDAIVGEWKNEDKGVTIKIYAQDGKYHGQVIGHDNAFKNRMLKSRTIMMLQGFEATQNNAYCCGIIKKPRDSNEYKGTLTLLNGNTLEVKMTDDGETSTQTWVKKA